MKATACYFVFLCQATLTTSFSPPSKHISRVSVLHETAFDTESNQKYFFGTVVEPEKEAKVQTRALGSQELLMVPRQYAPNKEVTFHQMNHVSCTLLSATPDEAILLRAIEAAAQVHPLLQAHVQGDGEPEKRIDLFQMVREGDPNPMTFVSKPGSVSATQVLSVVSVDSVDALDASWKASFARDLDDGSWCNVATGPLWKVELHRVKGASQLEQPCALVFAFNHAISDQSSANRLTDQILRNIVELEETGAVSKSVAQKIPLALEDSVLGENQRWSDIQAKGVSLRTISYVAGKAAEGLKNPVILPDAAEKQRSSSALDALSIISGRAAGGEDEESMQRRSTVQFRSLSKDATKALVQKCRENGVSVSNALTAAAALTATDFVDNGTKKGIERNYKVLQSLDMRRFGAQLDKGETVACMAGSMDLMHGPLEDRCGEALRKNPTESRLTAFWDLAREGKRQTEDFVESGGPQEAVRVFDFAMTITDLNNLVYLTAQSKASQGRAYSAGVTNAGVYERQSAFERENESQRATMKSKYGKYEIVDVFYATPHTQSGCLYQVSCLTVNGQLKITSHPVRPIVSEETNEKFADAFIELLDIVSGSRTKETTEGGDLASLTSTLPKNLLTKVTALIGAAAVLAHAPAWASFFQSVMEMKANVENPADFWAALNFWIFFAVGHPILEPILWISDVLHGSPGPKVADLVPVTFLIGNAIAIAAVTMSKEIRNAVNVAALSAFLAYVGAGLDGQAGLGDYQLALDDSYRGQVVKGCPAYEEVRQPSMDGFDLNKYQGLWYEHKFHDWTQFKEVYDTTLGIKLTDGGKGWVDDFAVKGPAPDAAPLSWDKSPVANGAHYFLFGRVDARDPPGVLRESGFGVEFPNYIVDVKTDPVTGEYKEAIQFQCLERGGVRVFEGINFMSRNPTMTEEELAAMHARAEKAGMYPYGASPDQMHQVARRPVDAPEIDNSWQAMWKAIGLDRLLELLTESIEDGGRQ